MARRETFNIDLKCPDCGATGQARASENGDPASFSFSRVKDRRIESVPAGFTLSNHGQHFGQPSAFSCSCGGIISFD